MRILPRFRILIGLTAALLLSACAASPQERFESIRQAAQDEAFEAYLLGFTIASAEVIRGSVSTGKRSGSNYKYFKNVYALTPEGSIESVETRGSVTWLTIEGKRGPLQFPMVEERGRLVIDGFGLPAFWAPMAPRSF